MLDLLEPVKLIVWKVVTERVTVIKFRMDNGGGNSAGCFEVEIMGGYSEVHECDSSRI